MTKAQTFYYHFNPLNFWLLLNLFVSYVLICCAVKYSYCCRWAEYYILCSVMLISWGLWIYKHFLKHPLAVITEEYIKIDHCQPLYWKNIVSAEEKIVRCFLLKKKIITLIPKKGMDYKYNFLQRHNGPFTPFSLPLYPAIKKQDAIALKEILMKKIKYTSLPEN